MLTVAIWALFAISRVIVHWILNYTLTAIETPEQARAAIDAVSTLALVAIAVSYTVAELYQVIRLLVRFLRDGGES